MRLYRHMAPAIFFAALAAPALAEDWSGLLLDRTVTMPVPEAFGVEPVFNDASAGSAIAEFVPPSETEMGWTQMLTLTAYDDGTDAPGDQLAMGMASNLAQGFANVCPASFSVQDMGTPAVPGAEASFAGWLSCGSNGAGQYESMIVLVLAKEGTVYTVQWAEHGAESATPLAFDAAVWQPRLDALLGLAL